MSSIEHFKVKHNDKDIEACIERPASTGSGYCVILTHGAGGDMHHPSLKSLSQALVQRGFTAVRFTCKSLNLVYRTRVFKSVLRHVQNVENPKGCFIGGRSMGSRAAVALANDLGDSDESNIQTNILGVVCLSYPLHTEDNITKLRDEPIKDLVKPSVFVGGTKDAMCDMVLLKKTLVNCGSARIQWIENANHACKVKGRKDEDVFNEINEHVISWCSENIAAKQGDELTEKTVLQSKRPKESTSGRKRKKSTKPTRRGKKVKR